MLLTMLDCHFIKYEDPFLVTVERIEDAQGILFLCPKCFAENKGEVGTHGIEVSFADRGVLPHQGSHNDKGEPSRWSVTGTGLRDLTTLPSIFIKPPGCGWHGYIKNGDAK